MSTSKLGLSQIQFAARFAFSPDTLTNLNNIVLSEWPSTVLRETLNGYGAFDDLSFLRFLPDIKKLTLDILRPASLEPILKYTQVQKLWLGGRLVSLAPLAGSVSLTHFLGNY